MAPLRRAGLKGFSLLGLAAALCAFFFGSPVDTSFAMLQPSEAAPQETPEMSRFRVGDRVTARVPMKISHEGRGYFNEGGGYGVPEHQRDEREEAEELAKLPKVVEGGSEGYVVGILPAGEWANRPKGWKGRPRPGVMVNWDDDQYPIDVTEEMFLTQVEGESLSRLHIRARKQKWRKPKY
eukprot:symbB.v1.2.027200.t1/scaffold2716.1/size72468/7